MTVSKVVLVTGGSSGIGEAIAIEFMKNGYRVAFTGRNKDRIKKVFKALVELAPGKSDEHVLAITVDFEDKGSVETVIQQTVNKFGRLDVLINNAGYSGKKRTIKDSDFFEDFQNIMQVNLVSAVRLSQLAVPHLVKAKGVIINVSSIADRVALDSMSYSISKAGMSMLTKTLANALEGQGVRSVGISPGPVKTNFAVGIQHAGYVTSLGRVGESEEVAQFALFLASDKASFIHGSVLDIDGGTLTKFGGTFRPPKLLKMFT